VDRGKRGIKRSMAVDACGIPLAIVIAPANRHDSPLLADTLNSIQRLGELPDLASVHLDRAYDSHATRQKLATRRLRAEISEKGKPAPVKPPNGGWWNAPALGITPTRSWCGAPSERGGLSISGSRFPK
jgi:hypothetical protein